VGNNFGSWPKVQFDQYQAQTRPPSRAESRVPRVRWNACMTATHPCSRRPVGHRLALPRAPRPCDLDVIPELSTSLPTPPPRSPRPLLASSSSRSAPESALRHGRQANLAATGKLAVPHLHTLHEPDISFASISGAPCSCSPEPEPPGHGQPRWRCC
jgi:hypothetical protein